MSFSIHWGLKTEVRKNGEAQVCAGGLCSCVEMGALFLGSLYSVVIAMRLCCDSRRIY